MTGLPPLNTKCNIHHSGTLKLVAFGSVGVHPAINWGSRARYHPHGDKIFIVKKFWILVFQEERLVYPAAKAGKPVWQLF